MTDPMFNPGRRIAEARKLQRAKRLYWLRKATLMCGTCGEPIHLTGVGLVGIGGVCRNPFNPNQDDEGLHIVAAEAGP